MAELSQRFHAILATKHGKCTVSAYNESHQQCSDQSTSSMLLVIFPAQHSVQVCRLSDLHNRGHLFQLPEYATDLHKKSFIIWTL